MNSEVILLVEDDDNDVLFMRSAMKKAGLSTPLRVVTDGQVAIDYLSGTGEYSDRAAHPRPFLILLDLNLPCRTGFEVLEWIRAHPALRTLLVIVLTSSSADADARRAYALGANSYLIKPSNPDKLRELIAIVQLYWLEWNHAPPDCQEP